MVPPWTFTVNTIEEADWDYPILAMLPPHKEMILCRPDNFCLYRDSYERRPDDDGNWFTYRVNKEETELTLDFWGREGKDVFDRSQNPWHHVILTIPYQQHVRWGYEFRYVGEPMVYNHTVHLAVGVYAVMMDIPLSDIGGKS